jgi:hypothetical protein
MADFAASAGMDFCDFVELLHVGKFEYLEPGPTERGNGRVTSGVSKVFLRIARKSILFEQTT